MKTLLFTCAAVTLFSFPLIAEQREVEGHEHGHAELSGVVDGQSGLLELHVPAESIVGFENMPKDDDQKEIVVHAINKLSLSLKSMLDCNVTSHEVELEAEGDHAEFHAEIEYDCATPPNMINAAILFEQFMDIEEIDVEMIVNGEAITGELEADASSMKLK